MRRRAMSESEAGPGKTYFSALMVNYLAGYIGGQFHPGDCVLNCSRAFAERMAALVMGVKDRTRHYDPLGPLDEQELRDRITEYLDTPQHPQ
jgi:hypothetical protein